MLLAGEAGDAFEMWIEGYQFPEAENSIAGHATVASGDSITPRGAAIPTDRSAGHPAKLRRASIPRPFPISMDSTAR